MKKILILLLLSVPSFMMAQNDWQAPNATNTQPSAKSKKQNADKDAASKEPKIKLDKKYAAGAVPLVEGKVEWSYDIEVPGKSAEELYDSALAAFNDLIHEECQSDKSNIAAVNKKDHIIAAHLVEELLFSKGALARDFTEFRYTLIATCTNGKVNLRLCRISYHYEKGRSTEALYTAEEWITDEEALNKSRTNTYRINGKFRKKTIDRKDVIFSDIERKLKFNN